MRAKIIACHAEHPDWTAKQIAEHLGAKKSSVSGALSTLGLRAAGAPRTEGRQAQIAELHKANPDWAAYKIAEAIGIKSQAVITAAKRMGITLPSREHCQRMLRAHTLDALRAAAVAPQGRNGADGAPIPPQSQSPPASPLTRPKGTRFYLRDRESGHYLHQSVTKGRDGKPLMTSDRKYAWCDSETRLLGVRRVMPETMALREEVLVP